MKYIFKEKNSSIIIFCCLICLFFSLEALSQEENPLPLTASYQDGDINGLKGFNPEWQLDKIEKGHHLQLVFGYIFRYDDWFINSYLEDYYENPIKKAARYGIPLVIRTSQPEGTLSGEPWISLPPDSNPNVVESDETVQTKLSPCGPVEPWRTIGKGWVNPILLIDEGYPESRDWWSNPILARLQNWYPNPPFVIWHSNNEASTANLSDVHEDYRFEDAYSSDPDYANWQFRNEILGGNTDLTNPGAGGYETGHGYIPRYNAMFDGMREELDEWSDKVRFVCYEGAALCFGRYDGWVSQRLFPIPGRFSATPYMWDGASPSYYVNNWQGNRDFLGCSPQMEAMNLLFQRDHYKEIKPDFWWEISTWFDPDFIEEWEGQGQEMPPERYASYVKWGMWLTRPRMARIFQFSADSVAYNWRWFEPIVEATDEIHLNPTLERFWKYSEAVLLTEIPHPWRYSDEFWPELFYNGNERMRWYQLPNDTTYEPVPSDNYGTMRPHIFNVWIMANVVGTSPNREWLIYAYTPLVAQMEVTAEIPGYGDITITAKRGGTYYLVRESGSDEYIETEPGVRAAEHDDIELEVGEGHRFNGIYSTAYKCNITNYAWDFDDGTTSDSIATNHSFSEDGIYEVELTVTSDSGTVDLDTITVTVGSGGITPGTFSFSVNPIARENALFKIYLPEKDKISLHIYDVLGRLVSSPLDGKYPAGVYEEKFSPAIKGIYFYKCESSYKKAKGKIIIF